MSTRRRAVSQRSRWIVVGIALALPTVVTWAYFTLASSYSPDAVKAAYGLGKTVQFALPLLWVWLIERPWKAEVAASETPATSAPLPRQGMTIAVGFGVAVVTSMLVLYHLLLKDSGFFAGALPEIQQKLGDFALLTVWRFAAFGVFYALVHSFLEEYYWRWFVFGQCRRLMTPPRAMIVSSLGFMAHHVLLMATYFGWTSWATWFFSLSVFVGGVVWAWLYHRSGSLIGVWLSHLLVDAGIFLVGYDLVQATLTS